jgi:hypothetical protein
VRFEPNSKVSEESEWQEAKQLGERILTEAGTQIDRSDEHSDRTLGPSFVSFELDSKAIYVRDLQFERKQ